ncbi:MAG: hypothetical protein U0R50_16790 [Gaiellales bacterium]
MDSVLSPYTRLVELARIEAELVARNTYEELESIAAERAAIMTALPDRAPREAGPLLAEAQAVVLQTERAMTADLVATERALAAIDGGRRVAVGYGGGPADRGSFDSRI